MVRTYVLDRKFEVSISDTFSNVFVTKTGVPQGSNMGPTMYMIPKSTLVFRASLELNINSG